MNFSDKSLVVSGCSFSAGGGLDNPDFWETLFPNINKNDYLFHAGTEVNNGKIFAIGGRVLNFVTLSDNFKSAKNIIYKNLNELNWTDGFYRKDIGFKVIE